MLTKERGAGTSRWRPFDHRALTGVVAMLACGAVTVLAASDPTRRLIVGVLVLCAELGMLASRQTRPSYSAGFAVAVTIGSGLAAIALSPSGLGEVPALAGVSVLPLCIPAGPARIAAVGTVSIAFGLTIMAVSGSLGGLLAGVGAWFIADRSVAHSALEAERDRAVALLAEVEASRQAQQEAAATEERNRIAREMHDVLAHSLAGLSVHLQAIRAIARRENSPASLTGPLDRAAGLARDGVQEARAAVDALRLPHLRGVDDLKALVGGFPGDADLQVTGHPGRLGPEAGHAVYRAVQEAMTNATRYATGSAIEVRVAWEERALRVAVRDHGLPAGHRPSGVMGSGTGLRSMSERIEAVGGTVDAGPDPSGNGWRIEVRVPVSGAG
ncbi:sensor histidine kinase [Streptantibioticus silvisoli]|uniref:histidine kinase n=1 Tax=Streptantibioticus silvisoli TaxID=2705255 RepID=A0ABT6VVA1_9ACTN|nr:histidine kinase [Streptantibioticus silvisoli]MDI5962379.1 histidine kinase [Streptantibioticus silvisoli]